MSQKRIFSRFFSVLGHQYLHFWEYQRRRLNHVQMIFVLVFAINSFIVICSFCVDVFYSYTVADSTGDMWLIAWHSIASGVKILSTCCQGIFLVTRTYRSLKYGVIDGYFLFRLAFINIVTLVHFLYLIKFGGITSLFSFRSILLALDMCFRFSLICWCVYSYFVSSLLCRVITTMHEFLLTVFQTVDYERTVNMPRTQILKTDECHTSTFENSTPSPSQPQHAYDKCHSEFVSGCCTHEPVDNRNISATRSDSGFVANINCQHYDH